MKRRQKRAILIILDSLIFAFCLWLAIVLRVGTITNGQFEALLPLFPIAAITGIAATWFSGFYRVLARSFDTRSLNILAMLAVTSGILLSTFGYFFKTLFLPRASILIYILLVFIIIGGTRIMLRWYYEYTIRANSEKQPVVIYGAGQAGQSIASILSGSSEFYVVGFIDDDVSIINNYMLGRRIYAIDDIGKLKQRYGTLKVFLTILNLSTKRKREIFSYLKPYNVEIKIIPSLADVVVGNVPLNKLRNLNVKDLLGREIVLPIREIFSKSIENQVVLISGGGGSIGSELCRQIFTANPKKIVILEQSEYLIHKLQIEFSNNKMGSRMEFVLGSICDENFVEQTLAQYKPDIIYHAAAYKHVYIVENNPIAGVKNNILGTEIIARASAKHNVSRFMLVSTDKSVRPTNVMGATKRIAELVIQAIAQENKSTIFAMVRFGNVLGSSGSVVPIFKSQIDAGGPVTVTHKEVSRYFMTISEAAQLVVQASAIAKGGEVFLLDMGESIKIVDLAYMAIRLSGHTVKDENNDNGEIEISFTGLRPGEKLFEELLIDGNAEKTIHPKIFKANEYFLSSKEMKTQLLYFKNETESNDLEAIMKRISKIVPEYKPTKNE